MICKATITYLVLVFALSSLFYAWIISGGSLDTAGGLYTLGLMWVPALTAMLVSLFYYRSLKGLGWRLGQPRYLLIAYLAPILYAGVAYALGWLSGLTPLDPAAVQELDISFPIMLVVMTFGSLLSALGEEIGWRGFLTPHLYRLTGFTRTALISGVIWFVWHAPLIIFADYNTGTPTWYSLACFGVGIIGLTFLFTWLRLKSNSLWPAALLHASHNLFIQAVFDPLTQDTPAAAYLLGEFGLAMALAGVVVAWLTWRQWRQAPEAPGAPIGPQVPA